MQLHLSCSTDNEAPQNLFYPGKELIFTCISHDASHRWRLENYRGYPLAEQTFTTGDQVNRTTIKDEIYSFTLVQTNSRLVSRFSTVALSGLNNTIAECTDPRSRESVMIKIADNNSYNILLINITVYNSKGFQLL